jgi:nitroreductase
MNILRMIKKMTIQFVNKRRIFTAYFKRYSKYSISPNHKYNYIQYEAEIIRRYHGIEKGLSYRNFSAGFGKANILCLIGLLKEYEKNGYSLESECYRTALSNIQQYILRNKSEKHDVSEIETAYNSLVGIPNTYGGVVQIEKNVILNKIHSEFNDFCSSRHSIREFSGESVNIEKIYKALEMAQGTPSACNRQGWKAYLIIDKANVNTVLENQNGNRGFGNNIDKLILVTADLQCFNQDREQYQAYIDGGMYAMNLLYCLHYQEIATIPLSASLTPVQEKNVRSIVGINDSEILILFIGTGTYTTQCFVPKSKRKKPNIQVV